MLPLFLVMVLGLVIASPVSASYTLKQENTTYNNEAPINYTSDGLDTVAERIYTDWAGNIGQVSFLIDIAGTPDGNVWAEIWSNCTEGTNGTLAATSNTVASSSLVDNEWQNFTFTPAYTVTDDTYYCVAISTNASESTSNVIRIWLNDSNVFGETTSVKTSRQETNGGLWWDNAWDTAFKVYEEDAGSPTPTPTNAPTNTPTPNSATSSGLIQIEPSDSLKQAIIHYDYVYSAFMLITTFSLGFLIVNNLFKR